MFEGRLWRSFDQRWTTGRDRVLGSVMRRGWLSRSLHQRRLSQGMDKGPNWNLIIAISVQANK
jgi:hypothetical protein